MKKTLVISAFPACGKTYYFNNCGDDITVLDSDSSKFSWREVLDTGYEMRNRGKKGYKPRYIKVRNPEFPQNYIEHIKSNIGKVDYIFVSTHESVRKALNEAGIDFILVYPSSGLKEEWIGRCFLRGSDFQFCKMIANNWDEWMQQLTEEACKEGREVFLLKHGEYLSDIIRDIDLVCRE